MPRISKLCRPGVIQSSPSVTTVPHLDFLVPDLSSRYTPAETAPAKRQYYNHRRKDGSKRLEAFFFTALLRAGSCSAHRGSLARVGSPSQPSELWPKARHISSMRSRNRDYSDHAAAARSEEIQTPGSRGKARGRQSDSGEEVDIAANVTRKRPDGSRGPHDFFQPNFAAGSRLPSRFYEDVASLQESANSGILVDCTESVVSSWGVGDDHAAGLEDKLRLIKSIRKMEDKLARAKNALQNSLDKPATETSGLQSLSISGGQDPPAVILTKEDYLNLVDLYFYTHQSRFAPDSPDDSPTPLFLDEYSFKLSADFSKPSSQAHKVNEEDEDDERYTSPLQHVEEMLKSRQLREITVMQAFVELLLDDNSSNRALFEVYREFPEPGVAWLPPGVIRLFLQRMSTPWVKSEKSMLRYLSLIDDMQKARLPINSAEWSSAIYLAGRSFARVTEKEVAKSFHIWREMEQEAGVKSNHVTFNILFDIAVRAGKYVLGETVLKEMHDRGLRLNRLGRVSLIYYHGLRGDGDAVRKAYRDFVEAGEIVDTLVLNCVMASLINSQEPVAAEQVYERMKDLQRRLRKGRREDGDETLFLKYPPPASNQINREMASNSLGRILLRAAHLRDVLPEQHAALQSIMPLTPDAVTFRTMIAHHAGTSGDLDRLTVLMNDMTELFEMPLSSINFQLFFKGFAIHGASRSQDNKWTLRRLELVWTACREAMKGSLVPGSQQRTVSIPTVQEVDAETAAETQSHALLPPTPTPEPQRKLGAWDEFVLDLAAFPRERMIPIHKRKAPFGIEDPDQFASPFFPNERDTSSMPETSPSTENSGSDDDGEYHLPPAEAQTRPLSESKPHVHFERDSNGHPVPEPRVRATRPLIFWLIRAYQRVTNSRRKVEEVWFQIRKVWRPADARERDAVVRVLRRALRDCDRMSGK